jgi:uncharacterized phage-associated protein
MFGTLFDEKKAAHAAAYVLERAGGHMSFTRLSALLYLAERESFRQHAEPLTGDALMSVDTGPVLSRVFGFLSGRTAEGALPEIEEWLARGPRSGFDIRLRRPFRDSDLAQSRLSAADVQILDSVLAQYGDMSRAQLVEYTRHHCEEWADPYGSAKLIPYLSLLQHLGYSWEVACDISQQLHEQAELRQAISAQA